ncbi:MAG TPA: hypothetical protein VKB69_15640 [Micromonosporaceae bacterium]|nr:hypothetical protein [Micromonosporaceae bacterium]
MNLFARRAGAFEVLLVATLVVASWRLLMGWDWSTVGRGGTGPGPFSDTTANEYHGIAVGLVAVAGVAWLALRGRPVLGAAAVLVPLVALSGWRMADARTPDASFWPIGLAVLAILGALGSAAVAGISTVIRQRVRM